MSYGAAGCELDLRPLADGTIAICHDRDLTRFGGTGTPLSAMKRADLASRDVGAWFSQEFAKEPVPTLDQLFAGPGKKGLWLLELKAATGAHGTAINRTLCRGLAAVLAREQNRDPSLWDRCYALCFAPSLLAQMATLAPRLRLVRNIVKPPKNPGPWLARQPWLHAVDCDLRTLTPAFVAACRTRGLKVFTYTCNDDQAYRKARALGLDGILSDRPAWLVDRLSRENQP
jgi:glycerophosphoryl diester phosphodiesterase